MTRANDGGAAFAPHADVRIVISELYKMEAGLAALGLNAPALAAAREKLTDLSWRVHERAARSEAQP